jgi:two-component system, chemotaxis family, protein-glutamate methylesterase/glutaminase
MANRPTPVIIVSSYSQKENVFRGLELGAVDFVAKPDAGRGDAAEVLDGLCQKVLGFGNERAVNVRPSVLPPPPPQRAPAVLDLRQPPRWLVGIAASTGGPSALSELFSRFTGRGSFGVVLAQHMPERFTRTFAERLDRKSSLRVTEAVDGDLVVAQSGFVCPGRQCMEVHAQSGGQLRIKVVPQGPEDRYAPSGNRLLTSVAAAGKSRAIGVILTGMGDDGTEGARAILDAGGVVIAESEDTAVIYGMPGSAVRAGVVTRSLPLSQIADHLEELVR